LKSNFVSENMYSLVKFDSGKHYVSQSKRIKIIQGKNCVIKYKGAKYSDCLIDSSDMYINLKKENITTLY